MQIFIGLTLKPAYLSLDGAPIMALKLAHLLSIHRVRPIGLTNASPRPHPHQKGHRMTRTRLSTCSLALTVLASLAGCSSISLDPPKEKEVKLATPAPKPPTAMVPVVEKRETLSATGYAVISVQQHKNPAQQRLMAIRASKLDAYRSLTEQVYGQQMDANSTVADMVMTNDTFRTKVEGVIYGARLVSITPVGDDTYETTLSLDRDMVQELRAVFVGQVAVNAR